MPYKDRERANACTRTWYAKNRDRIRAERRALIAANPEKYRAYNRQRYLAHREQVLARTKQWRDENPGRYREWRLKYKYGLTATQFDAMLAAQRGACAICRRPFTKQLAPHVDHERTRGVVRELLCGFCNTAIGLLGEDPERMLAARAYLLRHRLDATA